MGWFGFNYLLEFLGIVEEVISYYEFSLSMIGDYLRMINKFDYVIFFFKRRLKSFIIKDIFLKIFDGKIYCEINYMFIKIFFDVVI